MAFATAKTTAIHTKLLICLKNVLDKRTGLELKAMIDEYAYYYNHERHQWSRGRMTPVEYEKYMQAMTDEEFEAYMEAERAKYANMKKTAEKKAIERAKTLGV